MDEPTIDPAQALVDSHVKRMNDIFQMGFDKSKELCEQSLTSIKKHSGQKSALLNRALASLGIKEHE